MKFKSSWLLFFLFIALAGVSWYLFRSTPDKISIIMADRDFAVKDIDKIQKIFLATHNKVPITLEKINGVWMLNGRYKVAANPIKNILETIRDIRMQSIPSRGHFKTIMEGIAVYGIKVELYGINNEKLKTFYVGGPTQAEYGTYFYMEHGTQPYIMEIPHFVGDVRARFELDLIDWRDKKVFDLPVSAIDKLTVEYPSQIEQSFIIRKQGNDFGLYDFQKPDQKMQISKPKTIKDYLESLVSIGAEDIQNDNPMLKEARTLKPYCIVSINQIDKKDTLTYKFYPLKVDSSGKVKFEFNQTLIEKGDLFRWHIDRSDGDFLLVQYPNIEPVFKNREEFK